jgi:hypothetical protein
MWLFWREPSLGEKRNTLECDGRFSGVVSIGTVVCDVLILAIYGFIQHDDMESSAVFPEPPDRDVYDSKPHGYRYSRDAYIVETCISCHQSKSLVFLASLLLLSKSPKGKALKVSCLRLRP